MLKLSYLVKEYMTKDIISIDSESTIIEAAKVMASDKNLEGYVIVLENGKPEGIVTERDIINKALAKDLDVYKTKVIKIMSTPLETIDPDDDIFKATKLLKEKNLRKLVVMRADIVYGIITAKGVAQHFGEYVDRSVKNIVRWIAPLGI